MSNNNQKKKEKSCILRYSKNVITIRSKHIFNLKNCDSTRKIVSSESTEPCNSVRSTVFV